jgi:glutathione S-transferase
MSLARERAEALETRKKNGNAKGEGPAPSRCSSEQAWYICMGGGPREQPGAALLRLRAQAKNGTPVSSTQPTSSGRRRDSPFHQPSITQTFFQKKKKEVPDFQFSLFFIRSLLLFSETRYCNMSDTLIYWRVKSRGWPAIVMAQYAGHELVWDDATVLTWPATKAEMPFGQLPVLKTGGHTIGQSGAIFRILARKYNLLDGVGDDRTADTQEMLIEQFHDMHNVLIKPMYILKDESAKKEAQVAAIASLHIHLKYLERLSDKFSEGPRLLVGSILTICIINIAVHVASSALDDLPKLRAFYERNKSILDSTSDVPHYVNYSGVNPFEKYY